MLKTVELCFTKMRLLLHFDSKICCNLQEDELKNTTFVVFANKQDIEGAMTVPEVANALGFSGMKRKFQIFKTSAIKGTGLDEAMQW